MITTTECSKCRAWEGILDGERAQANAYIEKRESQLALSLEATTLLVKASNELADIVLRSRIVGAEIKPHVRKEQLKRVRVLAKRIGEVAERLRATFGHGLDPQSETAK